MTMNANAGAPRQWTPEEAAEKLAEVERLSRFGAMPQGPVSPAAASPAADSDLFSAATDLLLPTRAERFEMPNHKKVWVHPVSPEEAVWLNAQAAREAEKIKTDSPAETAVRTQVLGQVFQVICCCRKGPEPTAAPVFTVEHAQTLYRNRGWLEPVQRICALSDRLGGDETTLQEQLVGFFGHAESFARIWSSRLSADTLETLRGHLEEFASCVSCVTQRGFLASNDLAALAAVLGEE